MSLPPLSTVYCINFPDNWLLGIDLYYFQSTPQYQGVKLIPPGFHVLHWGADTDSIRSGKFFFSKNESKLVILRYNSLLEKVEVEEEIGELDTSAIKGRLGDAYRFMIVYDSLKSSVLEKAEESLSSINWNSLTNNITDELIHFILPQHQIASSTSTTEKENNILKQSLIDSAKIRSERSSSKIDDDHIIQSLVDQSDLELNLIDVDIKKRLKDPSVVGRNLTNSFLDKSWYLQETIDTLGGFKSFLGTIQFSFLLMLVFANYSGAVEWFSLIQLYFSSESHFAENLSDSRAFLNLFFIHLRALPQEYFDQFWDKKDFIKMIIEYHENVYSKTDGWGLFDEEILGISLKIFDFLETSYGIDLPDQTAYDNDEFDELIEIQ